MYSESGDMLRISKAVKGPKQWRLWWRPQNRYSVFDSYPGETYSGYKKSAQESFPLSLMVQSELETNCFSKIRRFEKMDTHLQRGILCISVILLYFSAAILDYVALFSGNWSMVTVESSTTIHVFYGPWQICWIIENSFSCKNHSWMSTELLPSILLLFSVIIGKILLFGCLYQLMCIFKNKQYSTVMIAVVLKVILCALSLILHIVVTLLPKEFIKGQKLISFWNSNLTVNISTGLIVIMMLVLLYELFFIMKVVRPTFINNSVLQINGYMNPSFRSDSDDDCDFSLKDLSVDGPIDMVSASHTNDSSKDEFSSCEYQEDYGLPNNDSDSCSTGYYTRYFKREINEPRMATSYEEMPDTCTSLEMATKEPHINNIILKGQNNKQFPCVLGVKLRANIAQKIVDGHEIVPFNQSVLLLRRNIYQEWELDEMKAYVFQNLSTSDSELVIFELKNSQKDFTEVEPNATSFYDETSNLKIVPPYPYYCPHNTSVQHGKYSSKWNLVVPIKK